MTIAISLKVNDGLVLAADSASTIIEHSAEGNPTNVVNVYNHANKIANLRKGWPIGVVTWGSGSIGPASISTLLKDLRRRFTDDDAHEDWKLDPDAYSIEEVATQLRRFMYEESYQEAFGEWPPEHQPILGFVIAGHAPGESLADEYQVLIANGECGPPVPLRPHEDAGLTWNGEPEAITRLLIGFGTELPRVLVEQLGVPPDQAPAIIDVLRATLERQIVHAAMPIQDAIDLAEFLVDTTIKISRFAPGAPTVGGEIGIAAITKHEGTASLSSVPGSRREAPDAQVRLVIDLRIIEGRRLLADDEREFGPISEDMLNEVRSRWPA